MVQYDGAEGIPGPLIHRLIRLHALRGTLTHRACLYALRPEGKILLREIAERYDDDRGEDLGDSRVEVELFDEQLDKNIVQSKANNDQQEIAEQLDAAKQGRLGENDILVEKIAGRKADAKGHEKGKDIRRDGDQSQVDIAFVEDKVVADKIQKYIQQGIRAPANRVAEGLNGHQLAEEGVEKIDETGDPLFDHKVHCLELRR